MSAARSISSLCLTTVALAVPGFAHASPMTPASIFSNAAPSMKLLMVLLIVATLAAVVVTVGKLKSGRHLTGGSAFLSALRLGGPLTGLLGAAFNGLMMFIGLAQGPQPFEAIAPGLAEVAFLVVLGLFSGVVAVICHWAVEARIDRTVLKS
tara:strand:- start:298 stop:753 length:456 start_codon:yes stop_codon:yes gene_type:complete